MIAEHFRKAQLELGESPRWDWRTGHLYWVDINKGVLYRLDSATGELERFGTGMALGCLGLAAGGGPLLATGKGFARYDFDAWIARPLPGLELDEGVRFNDGAVDRAGRFWAGTKAPQDEACLYRLDPDGEVRLMDGGFTICNGIGWSPDNRLMYFTDSMAHTIYVYDFNLADGTIANRRVFARVEEPATPDGLTVDREGFIWSALWDGGRVVRFDPQGRVEREISVPVPRPTACTFGGPELDVLYITTAWEGYTPAERAQHPLAGDLFMAHPGIQGLPEPLFGK